ncbi:hypothetical protein [Parvularcula dongshanensis]|uniref:Uncharacterized protein n=1 Tax=Parvularcula dongshanensis TaxID=1173995 RepID=A0A840I5Z5_9PROT|nr:hypothetical protein [Parvularcula dongshanensis]MBB4660299.1 hypothetical protein [Parvularcula dongshanensis]
MTTYFAPTTPARSALVQRLRDQIMPASIAVVTALLIAATLIGVAYAIDARLAVLFVLGTLMIAANALAVVSLSAQLSHALHEDHTV